MFKYSSTPIQMFLTSNLYSFWNNMTFSELTESQYNFTCHVEYWLCHSNGIAPIVGCKILKDYALGCFVSNHKTLQSKHIYLPIFSSMYTRCFTKFGIKVAWSLQFLGYLGTLHLKFQKARTKIGDFLPLPNWLSQLNWDS